ncbi:hypothetical protein SORBI_3004G324500 [Sorghum bicolor]|nr:hypothetical protein SORBI_3004G324500 [Sorghum bicolor]OQU85847.1 hypothetical protein SORBI_3004G324500 [Sorghum bicolor]
MCALALLASKYKSKINFPGVPRLFSTTTHETCEIRTFYGTRKYDAKRFVPLLEHCRRYPILNRVPNNRLIGAVDPENPFLTSESGRFLSRSALMLPFISHLHGKSVVGSFSEGNVGVLRGTSALCFKKICFGDLNSDTRAAGYQESGAFLKELIKRVHGDWALDHLPPDLFSLLGKLEANTVIDEEDLLYDGCLCPNLIRAYVQFETWRLARKEFPAIGKGEKALKILEYIHSECTNYKSLCPNNMFLNSWGAPKPYMNPLNKTPLAVPSPSASNPASPTGGNKGPKNNMKKTKTKKNKNKNKNKNRGSVRPKLVDLVRHATVHSVEMRLMKLISTLSPEAIQSMKKNPYTFSDVMTLLHYTFPHYVPTAIRAFKKHRAGKKFGIKKVWKIPSLYYS